MSLPEALSASDLEDILVQLGAAADRTNIAKALVQAQIEGIVAPTHRGQSWHIPRELLANAVAACMQRRAYRAAARTFTAVPDIEHFRVRAAGRMLQLAELAPLVPKHLVKLVRAAERERIAHRKAAEQRECERRAELERRRQAAADAASRAREAEQQRMARIEQEQVDRLRKRIMDDCYSHCRRLALADFGRPLGAGWIDRPEFVPFFNDWPRDVPSWWLPPPGMYEVALAERRRDKRFGDPEPDWRQFVPSYVPGRPWPWRKDVTDA